MLTCSNCNAINRRDAHECVECGDSLARSMSPEAREEAAELRHDVNHSLKSATGWVAAVAWLYRLGAFAYALATVLAVTALTKTDVPLGAGVLVVVLTTLLSVLMLMGALHILFRPFLWTVAIASLATVVSVIHFVGPNPLGVAFAGSLTLALLAWLALIPTLRFRHLIAEHKDLYVLHHASAQTRRSLQGRSPHDRHERLMTVMRNAAGRAWHLSAVVAGGLCLASAVGTIAVLQAVRPPDFSGVQERFEAAWNANDSLAVGGFFEAERRADQSARLAGSATGHGWGDTLPPLLDGELERGQEWVSIDYEVAGLPMSAHWTLEEDAWSLNRIELPMPPLEPVLDKFLAAWRDSNTKAIVAFFSPDNRLQMHKSLEQAFERRNWDPLPDVIETQVSDIIERKVEVILMLNSTAEQAAEVTCKWHLRSDASWGLHGIHFPAP